AGGGLTRREALRGIGAAAGATLVAALPTEALADERDKNERDKKKANGDGRGNSDCAHFCQQVPPGASRGKCVSDAAHGTGLCFQCGPKKPPTSNSQLCK